MISPKKAIRRGFVPGGGVWGVLLFCFLGYSTLNRGFAYIGCYPFFIGEFALLFYFIKLRHTKTLPRLLCTSAGKLWLVFLLYNLLIFLFSAFNDVNESIRNSVFWVYAIFFYIGFCYGNRLIQRNEVNRFQRFFLICATITVVYFALYPIRYDVRELTTFLHGGTTALIGYYSTLHALSVGMVFWLVFYRRSRFRLAWASLGFVLIVFISQARASMLATGIIFIYMCLMHRSTPEFKSMIKMLLVILVAASIYLISGVAIEGQRGAVSLDFFQETVLSIFFGSDVDSLEGSRSDRLLWWADVMGRTSSTKRSLLFGMGFDTVLVDRTTGVGAIVRYPHNSFVSVFGFSGIIGLGLYITFAGMVLCKVFKASRLRNSFTILKWYPVFAIGFFVAAFFSTVLEAPFHSFVFWVISGVVYRIANQGKFMPMSCSESRQVVNNI